MKTGTKIEHERYGKGVVTSSNGSQFTVAFDRGGDLHFSRITDEMVIISEPGESEHAYAFDAFTDILEGILNKHNALTYPAELGEKWKGGTLSLQPENAELKSKDIPIETFFHKIVMVRDRLRVLEQHINSSSSLSEEEKINLQQYITRSYGSLTTFNVLFADKEDYFKGAGKGE